MKLCIYFFLNVVFSPYLSFCFYSRQGSRPPTPKSDSELVSKPTERGIQKSNPQMHWDWGELPQATKVEEKEKQKPIIFQWLEYDMFNFLPQF